MPTRDTPWPDGTPCWVDYGARDLPAAQAFYTDLFGWEYTEGNDEQYGGYVNALRSGRMAAGFGPLMNESDSPAWTTYFATSDSAAAVGRIKDAGGMVVVEPMEVAPFGTMTIALDPQGNAFGRWQAAEHTGVRILDEHGSLAWNEAMVDDTAAAKQFYSAVFGFTFEQMPAEMAGEGMDYATFSTGANPLGGLGASDPSMPTGWLTCFSVASADEAVAAVQAKGGTVTMPPMDTPFGRFAVVEDPWGAPFEVMENPPAA